ncbi:retrovirus-related pol polyprotein from transposon TNT 1-94 [Tanacetum coccineum]
MLSSTGVKPSTSASGSQPSGNTKKDKIQPTPSGTQKNKVEAHPRTVKSSLKYKNSVVEPKGTANVQHSKLNANFELLCVKCNGCMLSDNHDLCVLDFINDVNARAKSKSKKSSKRKVWKTTRKVFTNIGYTWRPTGRTFTIVGNTCPLTRITTTTEVPLRKPTALKTNSPKPVVTLVYSRKPSKSKTNVPVSKQKIIKSISANNKEPNKSWGSIVSDVPSYSLDECKSSKLFSVKFRNDHVEKILGYGDYQIRNVTISRVYYVESLGHNLFFVGQFCDSNLEVAFRQHTCFIRNLEGVDLLTGSRGNNLYTLSYYTRPVVRPKDLKQDVKTSGVKNMTTAGTRAIVNTGIIAIGGGLCFKLLDENQVVLRAPRQNGVYSLDLKNIVPSGGLENQLNHKVKIIRSDHGTEFKNHAMNELCAKKGIKREFSVARTPQQNGVAERKNRTLIEAARTMLADSLLPIPFWAEAVNTACYVLNREYILVSVKIKLNVDAGHKKPYVAEEQTYVCVKADQTLKDDHERMIAQEVAAKAIDDATRQAFEEEKKRATQATNIYKLNTVPLLVKYWWIFICHILRGTIPIDASTLPNTDLPIDPNMPDLEDNSNAFPNNGIFSGAYDDEDVGAETDFNNMDNTIDVSPIPTLRVHKDHPKGQILGDPKSAVQTRGKIQKASSVQQALVSYIYNQNRTNHKDHQNCLLACFLSQEEPKTISQALEDESWVEAMQEELLQFKLQKVWILVDLPFGKKAIGTKWVFRNKRDERSIVVKNKARLVAQGFRQEEGIDYDEVFAPVARIEAIRLFLAFASFMGFPIYQMNVKSAFLYGHYGRGVYVHQPPGFFDSAHLNKVYKVIKALYGLRQAPRAWSMIGSLMYLTASRPDIMFAVCACARFQVTLKASHLNAVKRIFRYLKHQPKLGLWYPRDSPFELEAFSDSDYGGASLDRKSTIGGCQFLGRRLISWQCKKQTIVANSTTEAEYVAAANCCGLRATYGAELVSATSLVNIVRPTLSTARLGIKVGAARQKFVLLVTVTTVVLEHCQFQTVNDVKQIDATVDSKAVVVTEASIRSLIFSSREVSDTYHFTLFSSKRYQLNAVFHTIASRELSVLCTNLSNRVLALESIKDAQAAKISALKSRIKKIFGKKECYHGMEYMETKEAVDEGRQSGETEEVKLTDDTEVVEDKSSGKKIVLLSLRTYPYINKYFSDEDITMAQHLIKMKEEKARKTGASREDKESGKTETGSRHLVEYIASLYDEFKLRWIAIGVQDISELLSLKWGIDLVLWGDLRIMFEETADDDIWKNQEKWIIKSWTFYENYGVHILALEDGTKIHMLAERRYPLIRETLERMMELRLTAESKGEAVVQIVLWYLDSGCSKNMTGDRSQLINFVNKFLGTIKFGNDHVAKILGYGDYQIRNVMILRVYYVEGLGHNLFSVGQFCDLNLEVAFHQHTCFIRNLEGVDLLTRSRGNNLYTLSLRDMMASSPICLLSKASKTNKKKPYKPKSEDTNQEKLYLLHMDLCGPMRVASVNGKKYILVIVDDYSLFTWVKFLRTDNGTEFVNQTLCDYYEKVGISHETSIARSPQQNGVVERRNRTLIEVARTMLIYAKAPLFLWAEGVATACYTQNRSIIRLRHGKTSYELLHEKLPELSFFYVFGALSYPKNDSENLAPEVIALIAEVVAPELAALTCSPSSTTVDQDAPSPSNSQTTPETQSPIISSDVEEDNHDLDVARMNNDPFFGILILENDSEASSSDVIPTVVHTAAPNSKHVTKWTKDHPLDNIIGELKRPVSTRLQLHEQALFCYYDAFLTSVEPKNYKDALTQACWIEVMQEELNEFERLEVWELIPHLDKVMVITLKWIYKVKLDELGGILKKKAHLVARGYRQEEGIDFEESFALVARLDAIQIFLAYAAHMNIIVY